MDLLNPKLSYLQLEAVPRKRHGSAKETVWIVCTKMIHTYIKLLIDASGC